MKKITVIGDLMCEPPVFEQGKTEKGFDFSHVFRNLKPLLAEADYCIANLETPLAGEEARYTYRLVSFNAPDEYAEAVRDMGIGLVSTANNHAMDRGNAGLKRTLEALDRVGLAHAGTSFGGASSIGYFELDGVKIAVVAYTYGTNYGINGEAPLENEGYHVNYLKPCTYAGGIRRPQPENYRKALKELKEAQGGEASWEDEVALRKKMGISNAYWDDVLIPEDCEEGLAAVRADLAEARKNADLVFFLPHAGGQFNETPGAFSSYILYESAKMGFDGIFAAHSHTLQKACYLKGTPCFYSMGNVTMDPYTDWAVPSSKPEYAVAAHLYLDGKKLAKTTFSITKIVYEDGKLTVYPVDALLEKLNAADAEQLKAETAGIFFRVTGREFPGILHEYEL